MEDEFWDDFMQEDALLRASRDGSLDILQRLVERGADINFPTEWDTPLILATKNGHGEIVKYLVEHGADINHITPDNENALVWAIRNQYQDIAVYLIEQGAWVDTDFLNDAVYYQEELVIQTLIDYGVEVNHESLQAALETGNKQILEYLVEHATTDEFPISRALNLGKLDVAKYLVNEGGKIDPRYPNYIKEYSKDLKLAQEQVLDHLLSYPHAEPALKKSIQRFLKNK